MNLNLESQIISFKSEEVNQILMSQGGKKSRPPTKSKSLIYD